MDTLILDLLDPEEARAPPMVMKDYSDEFKADAVALCEFTPGATYKSIAADLGINRATRREWVLRDRDRERRGVAPAAARSGGAAPARPGQDRPHRPLIRTSGSGSWTPGWCGASPAQWPRTAAGPAGVAWWASRLVTA
ncbi:transposase [Streptomyces flaveolus]|uniref:transposase n=1 Tax=Streptomyces flaveolus TaxID=67297 RepID=UPI00343B4FCD